MNIFEIVHIGLLSQWQVGHFNSVSALFLRFDKMSAYYGPIFYNFGH